MQRRNKVQIKAGKEIEESQYQKIQQNIFITLQNKKIEEEPWSYPDLPLPPKITEKFILL